MLYIKNINCITCISTNLFNGLQLLKKESILRMIIFNV